MSLLQQIVGIALITLGILVIAIAVIGTFRFKYRDHGRQVSVCIMM